MSHVFGTTDSISCETCLSVLTEDRDALLTVFTEGRDTLLIVLTEGTDTLLAEAHS